MAYCILAFVYLLLLLLFSIRYQGNKLSIGVFIVSWYLLSIVCSFFVIKEDTNYTITATVFFLVSITLFLLPAVAYKQERVKEIKKINLNAFLFLSYIFIVLGIGCYIYFVPSIISLFSLGLSIVALRGEVAGGVTFYDNNNPFYYILTLYCQFYPIVIAFYFYSITYLNKSRTFNNLLLFSSTGYIVNVLSSIGRSGLVYWPIMFVFVFILFRNFISKEIEKKIVKKIIYVYSVGVIIFLVITIGRFSVENFEGSVFGSLFIYFGDQFGNFNNFYHLFENKSNDVFKILPILNPSREKMLPIEELNYVMAIYGVDGNVFSTFIGDLLKEYDKIYVLLSAFFYGVLGAFFLQANSYVSFGKLLIIIVMCQIPITGIFFYDYTHFVSNVYMLITVVLALFFSRKIFFDYK